MEDLNKIVKDGFLWDRYLSEGGTSYTSNIHFMRGRFFPREEKYFSLLTPALWSKPED